MSPFIVTMIRSCNCDPSTCESDGLLYHETRCSVFNVPRGERESRLAVATLEEARTEVFDCLTATEDLAQHYGGAADRLAKSIEPGEYIKAPDGTTIQVEPRQWHKLARDSDDATLLASALQLGERIEYWPGVRESILTAWNAKHAHA